MSEDARRPWLSLSREVKSRCFVCCSARSGAQFDHDLSCCSRTSRCASSSRCASGRITCVALLGTSAALAAIVVLSTVAMDLASLTGDAALLGASLPGSTSAA